MTNFFSKWFFFVPVRLLRGENFLKFVSEVRQAEKFSQKELEKFQKEKIQKLLGEKANIPYLKESLENGSNRNLSSYIDILAPFPVIDKSFLSDNLDSFRNKCISFLSKRATSGSTGQPFTFYRDRFSSAYMDAVMYNAYSWHGIVTGERQARFWGMPFNVKKKREAILKDFLMNRIRLSAFDLTDVMFTEYYQKMCTFRPGYLYGYPSLIYEFACFCRDRNFFFCNFNLKAVVVTGEKLISDQKKVIEEVFLTKVVQEYGCSEVGVIGFDCAHGKMHVMSPNVIVEVIKNGKAVVNELGEVVVTELNAKSYPFIRYKLGDLGIVKSAPCDCGLKWPVLEIKEGRIDDYIITPEGHKVYDAILAYTFNEYRKYVKMFKAVQRENGQLEIKVVLTAGCDETILNDCKKELNRRISQKLPIKFIKTKRIEREKSGKIRYFVSEIQS